MNTQKQDLTGEKFNMLKVICEAGRTKQQRKLWLCECECGNTTTTTTSKLRNGHTKSCGCLSGEKHNLSNSIEYKAWANAKQRCTNDKLTNYNMYGGRGISMCKEWSKSFTTFLNDIGKCPKDYSLERINVNGNYCKENCEWASRTQQARNQNIASNNTSGCRGVTYVKRTGKWLARIRVNKKRKQLGYFNSFVEAKEARLKAEKEYWN